MRERNSGWGMFGTAFVILATLITIYFDAEFAFAALLHPVRIFERLVLSVMAILFIFWLIAQVRGPRNVDGTHMDVKALKQKKLDAQLRESMQEKSTVELFEIWMTSDSSVWTDAARDAAMQVIKQRRTDLPHMIDAVQEVKKFFREGTTMDSQKPQEKTCWTSGQVE